MSGAHFGIRERPELNAVDPGEGFFCGYVQNE